MVRALPVGTCWAGAVGVICLAGAGFAQVLELHCLAQVGMSGALISTDVVVAFIVGRAASVRPDLKVTERQAYLDQASSR